MKNEKIFKKIAKENMKEFDLKAFKNSHPSLFRSIMLSMNHLNEMHESELKETDVSLEEIRAINYQIGEKNRKILELKISWADAIAQYNLYKANMDNTLVSVKKMTISQFLKWRRN